MKNNYAKSIITLFSICLAAALILALGNYITAPVIERSRREAESRSLSQALPEGKNFEKIEIDDTPETVTGVYRDKGGAGYVVTLKTHTDYSSEDMQISVGIGADGKIAGVMITAYSESKDIGDFPKGFSGKDRASAAKLDTVAGATYSSTAVRSAVEDAFAAVDAADKESD